MHVPPDRCRCELNPKQHHPEGRLVCRRHPVEELDGCEVGRANLLGDPDSEDPVPAGGCVSCVGEDLTEMSMVGGTVLVLNHDSDVPVRVSAATENVECEGLDLPFRGYQLEFIQAEYIGKQVEIVGQPGCEVVCLVRQHVLCA